MFKKSLLQNLEDILYEDIFFQFSSKNEQSEIEVELQESLPGEDTRRGKCRVRQLIEILKRLNDLFDSNRKKMLQLKNGRIRSQKFGLDQ